MIKTTTSHFYNSLRSFFPLILIVLVLCTSARAGFLYTLNDGNGGANVIYGYSVNESTGALTAIAGSPFTTGGNSSGQDASELLTIDRVNRRLYAINDGSDTVSAYSINGATGVLTALPFSPIALPAGGTYKTIAVHPSGSPLIVGDRSGSKSASYVITASTATAAAGSPFSTGTAVTFSSVFSRTGTYFYTGGDADNTFAGFSVNAATGVLTALVGSPFATGNSPFGYATDAQGRLFLANNVALQVRAFTTASGIPTPATNSPFTTSLTAAADGALSPNDNFYAVADSVGNRVGIYQIAGSGAATTLTVIAGSPISSGGSTTKALVFNNTGTFLFAANGSSRNISTYNFNQTTGATTLNTFQSANTNGTTGQLSGIDYFLPLPPAATTTGVTSSSDPSVFGQTVTFTATVSTAGLGTPTGNVQFFDNGNPIGAPVALNASGVAQLAYSALSVGDHVITADYAGDVPNGFNPSTGSLNTNPQTVNKASTTTTITSNQNPVSTNVAVTYTATINAVAPGAGTRTGTVTISRNGSPICSNVAVNASGQATCTITFTVAGSYNITATYSGSGNFNASSTASPFVQQTVGPTAAAVSVSGRVLQGDGLGMSRVRVTITDPAGNSRFTLTNPFGYFRFADVPAGGTYIFTFRAKNYQTASSQLNVLDNVAEFSVVLTN